MRVLQRSHSRYSGGCVSSVPTWAGALRHWASVSASSLDLLVKVYAYLCKDAQFQLLLDPYNCWKGLKNKSVFRVWPLTNRLGLALSLLLYIGKDSKRWLVHPCPDFLAAEAVIPFTCDSCHILFSPRNKWEKFLQLLGKLHHSGLKWQLVLQILKD